MNVISKQVYLCPICMFQWNYKQEALTCMRSCRALKAAQIRETNKRSRIGDEIRLNVSDLSEIKPYLIEFCKRTYNVSLKFNVPPDLNIIDVSCTHAQPIGKPLYKWHFDGPQRHHYPGCRGRVEGILKDHARTRRKEVNFGSLFNGGLFFGDELKYPINGFHTGTGNFGAEFHIEFYFFIQDFPKLYEKWYENQFVEKL